MTTKGSPVTVEKLAPGVWGVLATPLTEDGSAVDTASLTRQVEHYVRIGATGLTALGVFGEAARLTPDERRTVVATVAAAAADLPMVIGLSSLDTEGAVAEAANVLDVLDSPPAALMVQVGSPDPDAVVAQVNAVAERSGQRVVVQDYPVVSGVSIAADDLVAAVRRIPAAVAVKSESSPSPPAVATLVAGLDVPVFGGLGGTGLLDELAVGSAGAMTGFSVPEGLIACVDAFRDGGYAAAREVWRDYLPLVNFEFQAGIALSLRKHSFVHRGMISTPAVRPPAALAPESMLGLLREHLRHTPHALPASR